MRHAAAMIFTVKNNCSGITTFPATRKSYIYGDGKTGVFDDFAISLMVKVIFVSKLINY
jgi:hypothetical protein